MATVPKLMAMLKALLDGAGGAPAAAKAPKAPKAPKAAASKPAAPGDKGKQMVQLSAKTFAPVKAGGELISPLVNYCYLVGEGTYVKVNADVGPPAGLNGKAVKVLSTKPRSGVEVKGVPNSDWTLLVYLDLMSEGLRQSIFVKTKGGGQTLACKRAGSKKLLIAVNSVPSEDGACTCSGCETDDDKPHKPAATKKQKKSAGTE